MIPLPGTPKEVYERDMLAYEYDECVAKAIDLELNKERAMQILLEARETVNR